MQPLIFALVLILGLHTADAERAESIHGLWVWKSASVQPQSAGGYPAQLAPPSS